jgi:hypothetical protein
MPRTRQEIELSLCEAMNIAVSQQQYLSDKLAYILNDLPPKKTRHVLEKLEEKMYEICSEEPLPNTSKLEYVLKKMEDIVYKHMLFQKYHC